MDFSLLRLVLFPGELAFWFENLLSAYKKWTDFIWEWRHTCLSSIKGLKFPFPYRKGQKELVRDVYRTIRREQILFLQAPTGVGKTISTLFPALHAIGEEHADRIFYLTAKTVTASVAWDTLALFRENGVRTKVLRLFAKEKLCPMEEVKCTPSDCPRAKGHFDRVNDAVYELLTGQDAFGFDSLAEQAEKHQVCPFEMALDLSEFSDVILCDYNYVFDPNVRLKRFFADGAKSGAVLLVDEAHNLIERGRKMYSADLVKEGFLSVRKIIKAQVSLREAMPSAKEEYVFGISGSRLSFAELSAQTERALSSCNRQLLSMKRESERYMVRESIGNLSFSLMRLYALLEIYLRQERSFAGREEVLLFFFRLRHFLNMSELCDEHYVIYTDFLENGSFSLQLFCVDPSANLQACMDQAVSSVLFSATMLPIRYYKRLLCDREDPYAIYAQTAFSPTQQFLYISPEVTTLYKRRGEDEYHRMAEYILETITQRKGNYLIFCPYYQML